ncbi:MAG TPA: RNA polymerase sigma factor [Clostridiaceae bacterium]|nr:RNA polymerase sigma factor [Clostridiaceae bacterium]
MHNEKEIIERILSGDAESFRYIVDEYKNLVFSICLNMTRDWFEAENLTQEIFIKAYNSLSAYRFMGLKTWISRIAVNKCIDNNRRRAKRLEELTSPDDMPEFYIEGESLVEEHLIQEEEKETIIKLCESLPQIYSSVIKEYFLHSKSIRKIAAEGGLNEKTVETRLYRAVKMLSNKWKEAQNEAL